MVSAVDSAVFLERMGLMLMVLIPLSPVACQNSGLFKQENMGNKINQEDQRTAMKAPYCCRFANLAVVIPWQTHSAPSSYPMRRRINRPPRGFSCPLIAGALKVFHGRCYAFAAVRRRKNLEEHTSGCAPSDLARKSRYRLVDRGIEISGSDMSSEVVALAKLTNC